jgi:DNA end-binding protein Ku
MPRPLWTGSLSFGLVNVPVRLTSAVRDLDLHFRQLHATDHVPVETRRTCSAEEVEVDYEDIGNAYDLDGETVILTDDELSAADPRKTRTIDIEAFVDLDAIDPIYFDHPYFLVPAGDTDGTLRAYRLLAEVMGATEKAALGRFVLRTKEYLVAIRVREGALTLSTLRFHDEVRDPKGIDGASGRTKRAELDGALKLIDALTVEWDPADYEDEHRKRLQAIVKRKAEGGEITAPKADTQAAAAVPDLMAALEQTLARLQGGGDAKGGGAAKPSGGEAGDDLAGLSKGELYAKAQDADVPGRSKMTKDELVDALAE